MPTSTVPAVWAALFTRIDGATSTTTHYGPPMTEFGDFICVGYADDGPAVDASSEWAALGQQKHEERYGLACLIRTASGDVDLSTRVTAAYALLATITTAIASEYTLGGTCRIAHVADHTLVPLQDNGGSEAILRFTVAVAARI